jgi:CIC family chloride channel protein
LILAALKILATGFSFLSGTPGGMFAPVLFIGAMLGAAVGAIEQHFFPGLTGTVGTFALVGMGTFFAGFLRTPITSVFMVIEVSGNYTAILPVMISSLIAYGISRTYQKVPLFDLLARQDGILLPSTEERREQMVLTVEDAMQPDAAIIVEPGDKVADAVKRLEGKPKALHLLRVRPGEWNLVDRDDLLRLAAEASQPHTISEVRSNGPAPFVFRDMSLEEALRWAGDWTALPVLSRADLSKLEGVVTLEDILRAFRKPSGQER